jgi:cation-transporting ATPase 13A3/4/5
MFQASDWNLFENEDKKKQNFTFLRPKNEISLENKLKSIENEEEIINSHYEISIVRRFDFSSKLQRMSVITKNSNEDYYKLFCKGSPEKIKELCKNDTIPKDFNEILKKYTTKGFRVLALSFKMMKMNFIQSQEILREKCENNLIFLGLLIVQNKLKEKTKPSLELLRSAGMRMLMATGDNILTAISVSREAKLIPSDSKIMTCEITKENKLIWNLMKISMILKSIVMKLSIN